MSATARRAPSGAQVAVLERRGKFLVAEPFFGSGPRVAVSRDHRYSAGDLVVLRPAAGARGRAQVARRLGRPEIARDVIEALMLERGLCRRFDPAVEREARAAAEAPPGQHARRDLRELPTFTIDPAGARDFDDAISARRDPDGALHVWVHIADVSAFVPPRSLVDREAYRRATSVYVPGGVEPMLPAELSNQACSLVPGQDRLTVTVELAVDGERAPRASFYRSVIRSDERLEYDQVDDIFAGRRTAREPWGESLEAARSVAAALRTRRSSDSTLVLETAEPEFEFDSHGNVVSTRPTEQTESHQLIEQLMIAANEQVAELLDRRGVPALYRVHERPDGTAAERLVEQLASLGVPTPAVPGGPITPQQAAEVIGQASQLVVGWVARREHGGRGLTSLVLRSLQQAYYDHRNRGHAGLGSPSYCHFTSPIRRYPDLICHRALLSAIAGDEPAPEGSWVAAAGPWSSSREREAMVTERDADDIARCFLLERLLRGQPAASFAGEVVGVISAGAFVAFGENLGYQGMLPVRRLRGDWWELNEQATILVGSRSGATIRLGDPLAVLVAGIDPPRGRVDLGLAYRED